MNSRAKFPFLVRRVLIIAILVFLWAGTAHAQDDDSAYVAVVNQRAARIVDGMDMKEGPTREAVIECIAGQYRALNRLHGAEEAALAALEEALGGASRETLAAAKATVRAGISAEISALHVAYVARLAALLGPAQVEAVKDGMTYGVMPGTYAVYREMLPELNQVEMVQIRTWLMEARELAMDAGSAEEKHRVFGRYKGRINNFLSAAGYDLKEAERRMWERKKRASAAEAGKVTQRRDGGDGHE